MSSLIPTRLPEEATLSIPVDALAVFDGDSNNSHLEEHHQGEDHANGRSANGRASSNTLQARWQVMMLPVEHIGPNPWQPRTQFDPQEMEELTHSVKAHGVQQPVIVRTAKPKAKPETQEKGTAITVKGRSKRVPLRYELVAGERRLRASVAANRRTIPAIVRDDLSDLQVAEMALLENVQRSNLSAIEEARGYRRLMMDFKLSEERLAKKVGKSVQVLRDMMKLLALPEGVQHLIRGRTLTAAHGHELLRLGASSAVCSSVAAYAVKAGLPATALAKEPLPTARELEKSGLIVALDYRTRFDKTECKSCPHKAHISSGYTAYCLKPLEWKRKQEETVEREKDESARVLEEARRHSDVQSQSEEGKGIEDGDNVAKEEQEANGNGSSLPLLSQLPYGSYRDLRHSEVPPGCSAACSCRGCALTPAILMPAQEKVEGEEKTEGEDHSEVRVPLCLDTKRFSELQKQERVRREEERKRHYTDRFAKALHVLDVAWEAGHRGQAMALTFAPFLDARAPRGVYLARGEWQILLERVALQLDMELPFERLFDDEVEDGEVLHVLAERSIPGEEKPFDPLRLVLLGAGGLLLLEAESAARWGGKTPLLDFVLPPDATTQTALALDEDDLPHEEWNDDEDEDDEEGDPFMEEDFGPVVPDGHQNLQSEGEQQKTDEQVDTNDDEIN